MATENRLIDAINKEMPRLPDTNYKLGYSHGLNKAKDIVLKLDAVEVVHAEWIDGYAVHNGKKVYDSIDCSHCEEVFKIESETREYWKERFKVCPFCGALMGGGNEDG